MHRRRLGWPAVWGIAGVVAVLAQAIHRLFPFALELVDRELGALELAILAGWLAMSVYAEGVRGFHRQFAPRVIARAQHLSAHPRPLHVAIAPLYCMGLFHATRKRLVISWVLTLSIIATVMFVRQLQQPWRGIIDAGVVVGLGIGLVSIAYFMGRALRGEAMPAAAEVPVTEAIRS